MVDKIISAIYAVIAKVITAILDLAEDDPEGLMVAEKIFCVFIVIALIFIFTI